MTMPWPLCHLNFILFSTLAINPVDLKARPSDGKPVKLPFYSVSLTCGHLPASRSLSRLQALIDIQENNDEEG
jgi:hypothetical protein